MTASPDTAAPPTPQLTERWSDAPVKRRLVFTSAGDHSNLTTWLERNRKFDLCIAYYGDEPGRYQDVADFYFARKDSKFGNLQFAYQQWPELFAPYQSILVQDDDLIITSQQINRLFDLQADLDLWLLQAAFSPLGKTSWPITQAHWNCRLRYTNFVEMTGPLFRRDKLEKFMREFDPVLKGTGTDWWYMHSLGEDCSGKIAIIDEVTCINPHDRSKGGQRECDRLQTEAERTAAWKWASRRYGIPRHPNVVLERQLKAIPARWASPILHWPLDCYAFIRNRASILRRFVNEFYKF